MSIIIMLHSLLVFIDINLIVVSITACKCNTFFFTEQENERKSAQLLSPTVRLVRHFFTPSHVKRLRKRRKTFTCVGVILLRALRKFLFVLSVSACVFWGSHGV